MIASLLLATACGGGGSATPTTTNPPATPTGLTVTAGDASVSLSWNDSAGATAYVVKRSTSSTGTFTQVAAPAANSFKDTGLTNGTTYYYVVAATNSAGTSADSGAVSATPVAATTVPAVPTGLSAVPGVGSVAVAWSAVSGATGYHVSRGTTSGGPYTQVGSPASPNFADTGLTPGTTYYYVVQSYNSVGPSANSSQVSATPTAPAQPPAAPTNLAAQPGNAIVTLSWTASAGATTYNVLRSTASGGPYTSVGSTAAPSYTDSSVSNGTKYYYVVTATNSAGTSSNSTEVSATPAAPPPGSATITVTASQTHKISAYIYGLNDYTQTTGAPAQLTLDRLGGNRWTAYNWVTNASNAGSDYNYQNDDYLCYAGSPCASITPAAGAAATSVITPDQAANMATIVTVQMQGLVAADESGPVDTSNPPASDASHFKPVAPKKGSAFTTNPSASAPTVYMDEFVWALDQYYSGKAIFGSAPVGKPVFLQLDNEPELWNQTHLEIQGPNPIVAGPFITKSTTLAQALKAQFPTATVFGPSHYGFQGIFDWNSDPTISATPTGNDWFADQYIAAVKSASATAGHQLVDVYDFHWYPEATDSSGTRITYLIGPTLTADQVQAIVQSPRSLWDTTYIENSWIPGVLGGAPIYILGRLKAKIAAAGSPMGLSITEYNNGGSGHIAGTIAQADNLGIFGVQGLFAATFWELYTTEPYTLGGFTAFRNFDGKGSNFGDTSVQAVSSAIANVSAYVSTDSTRAGRVVIVAINRSTTAQGTTIAGQTLSGTAHLYQITAASAATQVAASTPIQPVSAGTQPASGSTLTVTLPALSVTTIDVY